MGLKELSENINKRPELTRHPKGRPFEMNFPIIQQKVTFEEGLNEELVDIIRSHGDTQRHKTNVKANMTSWFMQKEHPQFQIVGDKAISIAKNLERIGDHTQNVAEMIYYYVTGNHIAKKFSANELKQYRTQKKYKTNISNIFKKAKLIAKK